MARPLRNELTEKQQIVLRIIKDHIRKHGIPPSRPEIGRIMGLKGKGTNAVYGHLTALARKHFIKIHHNKQRGIQVLHAGEVPLVEAVGKISHQESVFTESRVVDRVPGYLADQFSQRPDYFLIQESGMDELGTRPGDLVAVQEARVQEARHTESGTVVVARVDGIIHCKRFTRIDRQFVELTPMSSNPDHKPLRIDLLEHDFQIDGIVVGTIATRPAPDPT